MRSGNLKILSACVSTWRLMPVAVVLALGLLCGQAQAASFDCSRAEAPAETTICATPDLSAMDETVDREFQQARKRGDTRALSKSLLARRELCGSDTHCLRTELSSALTAYKSFAASSDSLPKTGSINYGTRMGMQVSVLKRSGIDTAHAVIMVNHTIADATAFCREYVGAVTDKCIKQELAVKLKSSLVGNCTSGKFTTLQGEALRFKGPNKSGATNGDGYLIVNLASGQPLDGSMASGYPVSLSQFKELCPKRVPD